MEGGKGKQPGSLCIDPDRERLEAFNALVGIKPPEKARPPASRLPPVLPGIDINEGLMRIGNNPSRFVNLLRKFSINQADTVSAIETALASGKEQRALEHIHTLKGVSGNLSARRLRQAAQAVEMALKRDKTDLKHAMERLTAAMERLFATIATLPPLQGSGRSADSAKAPRPKEVEALAHELKRLLTESDTRSRAILQQLKAIVSDPVLKQRLQALDKPLEDYDFEQALEMLDGIPGV